MPDRSLPRPVSAGGPCDRRSPINAGRLWDSLLELGRVGGTPNGGVRRLALTDEDASARRLFARWAQEAGCTMRSDMVGNLFARREGRDPGRAAVMIGSHLDSQPNGGRFDGALGVLAGLEVVRTLADRAILTAAPVELAVWSDEEGARFDISCVGSSVFAGARSLKSACSLRDATGVRFGDELTRLRLAGDSQPGRPAPDAYFELHIEQGPELEELGVPIGIVEGITGIRWLNVVLNGRAAHAGTTPMDRRRDALLAAAHLISAVDAIAIAGAPHARATVCVLEAEPNAGSVITERARLMVDLRHRDRVALQQMEDALHAALGAAEAAGIRCAVDTLWTVDPVSFDRDCVELVADAASTLRYASQRMISGAGHDAGYLASVAPSVLVFIPCRDGLSHNPEEHAEPEHVAAGAEVLYEAVVSRAEAPRP